MKRKLTDIQIAIATFTEFHVLENKKSWLLVL